MEASFYVYVYLDPRKPGRFTYKDVSFLYEPVYVGKGRGKRYLDHLKCIESGRKGYYFQSKLKQMLLATSKCSIENCIIIFRAGLTELQAFDLEVDLIQRVGRHDLGSGPLANLTNGGDGVKNVSQETRKKISKIKQGTKLSDETKKKLSLYNLGKQLSEKTRQKMSQSRLGMRHSEECKRRISAANAGRKISEEEGENRRKNRLGKAGPNFGKLFSKEHKNRISIALQGKQHSEEHREKNKQAHLGKTHSEETKRKMSAAHRKKKRKELRCLFA